MLFSQVDQGLKMLRTTNSIINRKLLKEPEFDLCPCPLRESVYSEINDYLDSIEALYSKIYRLEYETHFIIRN